MEPVKVDPQITMAEFERILANVNNVDEFIQQLRENDVSHLIDSIRVVGKSQTSIIIGMHRLLQTESDRIDEQIFRVSETYKNKYSELLNHFQKWKAARENLIGILKRASKSIERNSTLKSKFLILTAIADIVGIKYKFAPESLWSCLFNNASIIGLMGAGLEFILGQGIHKGVEEAIEKDEKLAKKIKKGFQEIKHLEADIESLFPFGIDRDILQKIEKCSYISDECEKFFTAIIVSNVKNNVELFKNREFLSKAANVASSGIAQQWFQKVVRETDPFYKALFNEVVNEEIEVLLKDKQKEEEGEKNAEALERITIALNVLDKLKLATDCATIMMEASKLFFGSKPKVIKHFEKLVEKTEEQLEEAEKKIRFFKQPELQTDPNLE